MEDAKDAAGWGLRAINKVIGLAISKIVEAEQVNVWVKTTLSQAMRGDVEAIAIHLQDFLARRELRIETFHLQIGQVTVLPKLAIKGTIQLVRPTTGELTLTLQEDQLSHCLKACFVEGRSPSSNPSASDSQNDRLHHIGVDFLAENQLQISLDWTAAVTGSRQTSTLLTHPEITSGGETVRLVVRSVSGQDVPAELRTAILAAIEEILSLQDFKQRGTSFQIQQLEMTSEQLTLRAAATIHQFPSR